MWLTAAVSAAGWQFVAVVVGLLAGLSVVLSAVVSVERTAGHSLETGPLHDLSY